MIGKTRHSVDRLINKMVSAADNAIGNIPRKVTEGLIVVGFALVVVWLFNKNIYFGISAVITLFAGLILSARPIYIIYFTIPFFVAPWINLLGRRFRVITFLTLITFSFYVLRAIASKTLPKKEPVFFAYGIYLTTIALSLINSIDIGLSLSAVKYFVFALMFGIAMVLAIENKVQLRTIITILLVISFFESLLAFLQSTVSVKFYPAYYFRIFGLKIIEQYSIHGIRRASGTFESGPRYAMFLLMPIALTLVMLWRNLEQKRAIWMSLLFMQILGLFMSFTRAAMVLGVGYVLLYNFLELNWSRLIKSVVWLVLILIIVTAFAHLFIPEKITNTFFVRMEEDDEMYLDRFYFLYNAIRGWLENPILGLGAGTYQKHSWDLMQRYPVPWVSLSLDTNPLSMPPGVTAHNDYGRMLAETGIFSLIAFILLYVYSFRNYFFVLRNTKDEYYRTITIGFAMYLGGMIPYWYFHEYIMEETYTAMMPIIMSVVLKKLVTKEIENRSGEPDQP